APRAFLARSKRRSHSLATLDSDSCDEPPSQLTDFSAVSLSFFTFSLISQPSSSTIILLTNDSISTLETTSSDISFLDRMAIPSSSLSNRPGNHWNAANYAFKNRVPTTLNRLRGLGPPKRTVAGSTRAPKPVPLAGYLRESRRFQMRCKARTPQVACLTNPKSDG
ncbi:hypothetical protein HID58_042448, partial [Brassica napus]